MPEEVRIKYMYIIDIVQGGTKKVYDVIKSA